MTREEIEELKGLAASMGLYDDKNPCKRAVILGKAIKALQEPVIDKIKENIQFIKDKCLPNNIAEKYEQKGLQDALDIIDNIGKATGK